MWRPNTRTHTHTPAHWDELKSFCDALQSLALHCRTMARRNHLQVSWHTSFSLSKYGQLFFTNSWMGRKGQSPSSLGGGAVEFCLVATEYLISSYIVRQTAPEPRLQRYLLASLSLVTPAVHPASLLCGESYARSEGDARVNGTGQRPGQGKAGHTSDQLPAKIHPTVHLKASERSAYSELVLL